MSVIRPEGTPISSESRFALSFRATNSRFNKRPACTTGAIGSTSVVVDDFDLVCVAFAEFETDAPAVVHRHRPSSPSIAFELVQAHAFQRAEIAQRFGDIQGQQKIHGGLEVQPAKLVWPLAIPDLA